MLNWISDWGIFPQLFKGITIMSLWWCPWTKVHIFYGNIRHKAAMIPVAMVTIWCEPSQRLPIAGHGLLQHYYKGTQHPHDFEFIWHGIKLNTFVLKIFRLQRDQGSHYHSCSGVSITPDFIIMCFGVTCSLITHVLHMWMEYIFIYKWIYVTCSKTLGQTIFDHFKV